MDTTLKQKLRDSGYTGDFDLSSLVEACGDNFEVLARVKYAEGKILWQAYPTEEWFNKSGIDCFVDCCGYKSGDTPEEAVAALWLSINSPK